MSLYHELKRRNVFRVAIAYVVIALLANSDVSAQSNRDVNVTVFLIDIEEVSSRSQSFVANVFISLDWYDLSLAHNGPGSRGVSSDEIWNPHVQILNQQRLVKTFSDTAEVTPEGRVILRQRYWGGFSQPLELRDFPFDSQRLEITLVGAGFEGIDPNFIVSPSSGLASKLKMPDWEMLGWNIEVSTLPLGGNNSEVPTVVLSVDVKRSFSFFALKVIFPLFLIVAMSWLVFWIDPKLVATQISIAVTAMLTLIAYRFAMGQMVPRLSFLTSLEYFEVGCSVLVFLTLVEAAYTARLVDKEKTEQARAMDRMARWLAPLLFFGMMFETLWLRWGLY